MLRWLPDFLLVSTSNNEFKDAFFIDIKAMYTPIYLKTFPEQLKKEYGKQISIEDIGNIEREAYKSYTSHQKSGSKVAVLVACTYNPKLLLCDYIENLEIIYKDERERNKMSSGSTTPRVNIDLSKMSSFEDFLSPLMGDNFDRDLYQILFDFIEKEFNFIGYPRVVSKDRAEEVKEYLTKKVGRELLLKNI